MPKMKKLWGSRNSFYPQKRRTLRFPRVIQRTPYQEASIFESSEGVKHNNSPKESKTEYKPDNQMDVLQHHDTNTLAMKTDKWTYKIDTDFYQSKQEDIPLSAQKIKREEIIETLGKCNLSEII